MKALVVIDVQKEYMDKYEPVLLSDINQRIQQAIESEEVVIYIKNVRKLRSGITTYEFAENLNVSSPNIIYKDRASAFANGELSNILNKNNISQIEMVGVDGNSCVACSAIDGNKLGYEVTLLCKCIGTQNVEIFAKKKTLLMEQGIVVM